MSELKNQFIKILINFFSSLKFFFSKTQIKYSFQNFKNKEIRKILNTSNVQKYEMLAYSGLSLFIRHLTMQLLWSQVCNFIKL